jgi:hypothetical protein
MSPKQKVGLCNIATNVSLLSFSEYIAGNLEDLVYYYGLPF